MTLNEVIFEVLPGRYYDKNEKPIRCMFCGSKEFERANIDVWENHIMEYECRC